jgi:hypothetical protein
VVRARASIVVGGGTSILVLKTRLLVKELQDMTAQVWVRVIVVGRGTDMLYNNSVRTDDI